MTRAVAVAPAPAKHLMQLLAVMLFLVLPLTMVFHPVLGPVFGLDAAHAANQGTLNTYANQQRTAAGVKPLKVNARMTAVAQNAAARYANAGAVSQGESLSGSITAGWTSAGQVPHMYSPTTDPAVVYQRALAEPGKAATMNDGSWTDIGAGFATVGNATYVVVIYAKYPEAPKPVADPVPAPAPAPKVEAPKVVAPAPAPAPVVEAPKAQEPAPAPKADPAPKPESVPTRESKPIPTKKPEPTKAPSPTPKATATPTSEPSPEPSPSPEPDDERWRTLLGMDDGDADLRQARDHSLASSLYLLFGGSGGLALYAGRKVFLLGK